MTNDLAATVAALKDGDRVRATFEDGDATTTVEGPVKLPRDHRSDRITVGVSVLRHIDGYLHHTLTAVEVLAPALPPEPPVGTPVWFRERWMARSIEGGYYYPLRSDDRYLYVNSGEMATYNDGLTWADLQPCVPAVPQEPEVRAEPVGLSTDEPDVPDWSVAVFMGQGRPFGIDRCPDGSWDYEPWSYWTDVYGAPVAVIPAGKGAE